MPDDEELKHEDLIYFTALLSILVVIISLFYLFSPVNVIQEKYTPDINATVTSMQEKYTPDINATVTSMQERPEVGYGNVKFVIGSTTFIIILFSILRFYAIIFEDNVWRYITTHGVFAFVLFYILVIGIPYFANIFPYLISIVLALVWIVIVFGGISYLNNLNTNNLLRTSKYGFLISGYNYPKRGIEETIYAEESCTGALARKRISKMTLWFYLSLIFLLVGLYLIAVAYVAWKDLSIVDSIKDHLIKEDFLLLKEKIKEIIKISIIVSIITFLLSICFFIGFKKTKNKKEPKYVLFWNYIIKILKYIGRRLRPILIKIKENNRLQILIFLFMVLAFLGIFIIRPYLFLLFFFLLLILIWVRDSNS